MNALLELGLEAHVDDPGLPDPGPLPVPDGGHELSLARPAMGTVVGVTVHDRSATRAEAAVGRAFDEMDRLIPVFSRHDDDAAVAQLNRHGRLDHPPPELVGLVDRALGLHRTTHGAFDVSVQPLVDLHRDLATGAPRPEPDAAALAAALERVGVDGIRVTPRRLDFRRSGMGLTLDGIAKGFIVDAMAATLDELGVERYLIDAGGDIRARADEGRPWRVGVRDPAGGGGFPEVVEIAGGALATSGSYEIYFDADRTRHHVVGAADGRSPTGSDSVTVFAPTAAEADALATAAFVIGGERGVELVGSRAGREALSIDADGPRRSSGGWDHLRMDPEGGTDV